MYIGVSPNKFDELVKSGRMPSPKRIDGRKVWDMRALDLAFDDLPQEAAEASMSSWNDA
jgi:exosome complex RNA-binding protein Rrp42 (RNase PH superfamily)